VGTLLDSIDANRGLVETNLSQEFSDENYVARLSQINRYVKSSYDKITSLEEKLRKSKASGSDYLATIKKLKNDLGEREQKIGELTAQVEAYQEETATLMNTVALQGAELSDKMDLLAARQQEVTKLQTDIQKLITSSQISLADAYYAQAEALEEAARRTKLAPRKKKKTQAEALELYRLALVTGKTEAQKKVEELEKDI
jgi:chromosome segregation ATPase